MCMCRVGRFECLFIFNVRQLSIGEAGYGVFHMKPKQSKQEEKYMFTMLDGVGCVS